MKKLLFLLVFIPLVSFGQDYGNSADAIKLCSVLQTNNFGTDVEAEKGLDRILSVIGASKRFVLQPCDNINNAVATSYKGIRYILYDRDFMSSINSGNNWGNLFILAHEVGHHINGHSLDLVLYAADVVEPETLANQRKQELEADEFAGFILAKLGGPISAANEIISKISTNSDDSYSTHPSRDKRISSVRKGYNKTGGLISNSEIPTINNSNGHPNKIYARTEAKVKDEPNVFGSIRGYLSVGQSVQVVGKNEEYWKVFYKGDIGYIHDLYIKETSFTSEIKYGLPDKYKNNHIISKINSRAKLRDKPTPFGNIIKEILVGELIYVIGYEGNYWKVFYKGDIGYLMDGLYFETTYEMMRFK